LPIKKWKGKEERQEQKLNRVRMTEFNKNPFESGQMGLGFADADILKLRSIGSN
jgi:hypothetical protein